VAGTASEAVQSVASAAQTTASMAGAGVHVGQTTASEPKIASAAVHAGQTTASEATIAFVGVHVGHTVASVGVQVTTGAAGQTVALTGVHD